MTTLTPVTNSFSAGNVHPYPSKHASVKQVLPNVSIPNHSQVSETLILSEMNNNNNNMHISILP